MYNNPEGDGIFLVFKFRNDQLDTGSHTGTGSYRYKGPARVYNTSGKAKAQWTRYQREGYGSRVAEIRVDGEDDSLQATWISDGWVLKPELCKARFFPADAECTYVGWCPHHSRQLHQRSTCYRRKGHSGIHWSGREAKKDPDFDPEAAMKETSDA